jgi:hypothetical protein
LATPQAWAKPVPMVRKLMPAMARGDEISDGPVEPSAPRPQQ